MRPDDDAMLADWLSPLRPRLLWAPPDWDTLVAPAWRHDRPVWRVTPRAALRVEPCAHALGLDELGLFRVSWPNGGDVLPADDVQRSLLAQALALDGLAVVRIASAALARAAERARRYAHERWQGGAWIAEHPAVQAMLAEIASAQAETAVAQSGLIDALPAVDLGRLALLRARAHEAGCAAADAAVQVHGGIGYMRDCGAEKDLRDQLALRGLAGTPGDWRLFAAAWMEGAA